MTFFANNFGDHFNREIFKVRLSLEPLPVEHFNSHLYERGHHELSSDVFVSSVASFIEELKPLEV
jgi:hypothetical protein